MYENIERWFSQGLWNEKMIKNAVLKNKITQEQADKIIADKEV